MKGPIKLSFAIALALSGIDAFALGLGQIQVKSGLNEPLNAEIPVLSGAPNETTGLQVSLASAEDFVRVGLNRTHLSTPLEFTVGSNARGDTVIKVTTKAVVREPSLDFLIEVNWPKGKLLREYAVLLDPPIMAPALRGSAATSAPANETETAPAQKLAEEPPAKGKNKNKPTAANKTAIAKTESTKSSEIKSRAPASGSDYGPVTAGETLSKLARATRPNDTTNLNQMMLALLRTNPQAFYKDNINALKRGSILRIPSAEEIQAVGSLNEAALAVRNQNEAWRSGIAVSKPTLVANVGGPSKAAVTAAKPVTTEPSVKSGEHLALVPPRSSNDNQAAGASVTTGKGDNSKAELIRTKEALTAREQEAGELKSRVKDLEELKNKGDRLISLKDSEIAELQQKLKELQETNRKSATAVASSAPAKEIKSPEATPAKPAEAGNEATKLTAEDMWGDHNTGAAKNSGVNPNSTTTSGTSTPAATTPATSGPSSSNPVATLPSSEPKLPATSTSTPGIDSTITPSSVTSTPIAAPDTARPVTSSSVASPATASTASVAKPLPSPVIPSEVSPSQAWYLNPTLLYAGGGIALLLGLLAMLKFVRRPRAMPAGDIALQDPFAATGHVGDSVNQDERTLLAQLNQDPQDPGLHLELLSLYYAQRDVGKFEAAAETMYAHIADPTQPEWQQAKAMGEELAPHNPLFDSAPDFAEMPVNQQKEAASSFSDFDVNPPAPTAHAEHSFDFDLPATAPLPTGATGRTEQEDISFDLPPIPATSPQASAANAGKLLDEEVAIGEDTMDTKLDLAKAYLDMGDPEGARSMLEEVLAEGSEERKREARKLMAEIK